MDLSNIWVSNLIWNNLYYGNWFITFFCNWGKARCEARRQGTYVEKVASLSTIIKSLVEEENPFNDDGYQCLQHLTTSKPNVLRLTSTQTWKITFIWKFSFYENLSSPYWPMRAKILSSRPIPAQDVSSLGAEPISGIFVKKKKEFLQVVIVTLKSKGWCHMACHWPILLLTTMWD